MNFAACSICETRTIWSFAACSCFLATKFAAMVKGRLAKLFAKLSGKLGE